MLMMSVPLQVVATATHANARSFHAFSRDRGMPDRGFFSRLAPNQIPINAVWLVLFISGAPRLSPCSCARAARLTRRLAALMGLLVFASTIAVNAIFALAAMGMGASSFRSCSALEVRGMKLTLDRPPSTDSSYLFSIVACMIWRNHPEGTSCSTFPRVRTRTAR